MNYIKLDSNSYPIAINASVAVILDLYPNAYEISADEYRQEIFGALQSEISFHQLSKGGKNH